VSYPKAKFLQRRAQRIYPIGCVLQSPGASDGVIGAATLVIAVDCRH
jgi:hypothetical protein